MHVPLALIFLASAAVTQTTPVAARSDQGAAVTSISELRSRAEGGDADAQERLGRAYEDGNGVTQDDCKAMGWYKKAAAQDHAAAEDDLGLMYRLGHCVEVDKAQAVEWYRKAAYHRYGKAMFNLAAAYYNGDGVAVDDIWAYAWFALANDAGQPNAADGVERLGASLKPVQLAQALLNVGRMYETGEGLEKNEAEAFRWYRQSSEKGSVEATMYVASMLADGRGTQKDPEAAAKICEAAARREPAAAYCMGVFTEQGVGVAKDSKAAMNWFERAAKAGDVRALRQIGGFYQRGEGVQKDLIRAYAYLLAAGGEVSKDLGDIRAQMSDRDFAKANKLAAELARAYPAVRLRVPLVETPPELRPGTPQTLSAVLPQGVKHGAVVLWCAIDTNGKVTDARIEQSLSPEADAKALEAVKAWKFQPAKKNGNPVAVDVRITLVVENNGR